jgi:parallel beta-helix repeat protein
MPARSPRPCLETLDDRLVPAVLWVDDDLAQQPAAGYTSIQAAVDAASAGDTVLVYPGSYPEQVRVGTDQNGWPVSLYGRSLDNLALVSETPLAATISLPESAPAVSAILTVGYATGVRVEGFTIAGPGAYSGQLYDGLEVNHRATVDVRGNLFRDIGDPASGGEESGGQNGIAVYVGADDGGTAVIQGNTFVRYQKAGVVVDGPNSSATVLDNTFVGAGPTESVAQIGVQFSQNGSGLAQGNLITGHVYTGPAGPDEENPLSAAGVVVYQAGAVTVSDNDILANQTGVYVQDQSGATQISLNTVDGSTLDGIVLDLARASTVVFQNAVSYSGRDGIHVQSASHYNLITGNTVTFSGRHGIASVPTRYGDELEFEAAPTGNMFFQNVVSGSAAFDLYAQSASWSGFGEAINDIWGANTYSTKNRPGLR